MNIFTRPLAMAALVFVCAAAQAQDPQSIQATAFHMGHCCGNGDGDAVVSDANGVTSIRLASLDNVAGIAEDIYYNQTAFGLSYLANVNPGYRITGFSLSGMLDGILTVPDRPDGTPSDARAENHAEMYVSAGTSWDKLIYGEYEQHHANVNGLVPFVFSNTAIAPTDILYLWLVMAVDVNATPSSDMSVLSFASMRINNLMLTVYTTAVPEPESYAMLLAGLGVVAAMARRRRKPG